MRTILVTGGCGFIGSNFIKYMLDEHEDVRLVNIDALTYAGNLNNLQEISGSERYEFIKLNICDEKKLTGLFENHCFDAVVNFAAESHVDRSLLEPDLFCRTNVLGTICLLNAARRYWGQDGEKRFLQVSTDEVYGTLGSEGCFTEDTPIDPRSPYSASKASADLFVKAYYETYGMPCIITRCSNNYGPYQFPEKLIPLVFNNACNGKSIPLYGDGLQVRDWLYVKDHCKAIDRVLTGGRTGQVYNIGGHNEKTNIEIVRSIIDYVRENIDSKAGYELITYVKDRLGHDRRYAIDPTKIKQELGWQPETCFDAGIKLTLDWYKDNTLWVKNVTSGEYTHYYEKMYGGR